MFYTEGGVPWDFPSLTQFPPSSNLLTSLYTLYYFPTLMTSGAQSIIVLETLALYPETLYEHWFAYSTEQIEVPTVVLFALAWLLNFYPARMRRGKVIGRIVVVVVVVDTKNC